MTRRLRIAVSTRKRQGASESGKSLKIPELRLVADCVAKMSFTMIVWPLSILIPILTGEKTVLELCHDQIIAIL